MEIAGQTVCGPCISGGHIVLFQDFDSHHLGPPIVGLAPLQAINKGMILRRSQIAVRLLGCKDGFHPAKGLFLEGGVAQLVGQRKQAVHPVRSSLPGVSVSSQPGIGRAHHLRVNLVQMAGKPVGLPLKLLLQPAPGLYGAKGKFGKAGFLQRSPVKHLGMGRQSKQQSPCKQENSSHDAKL